MEAELKTLLGRTFTIPCKAQAYRPSIAFSHNRVVFRSTELGTSNHESVFLRNTSDQEQLFHIVLPKHDLEGKNWDTAWQETVPVSNGPFKMESWDRGQQIVFVKNENFFGNGPNLDRIVMRFVPETNTLLELLRSGEIDASDPQPRDLVAA